MKQIIMDNSDNTFIRFIPYIFILSNKKKDLGDAIKFEKENDVPKNCECCSIF